MIKYFTLRLALLMQNIDNPSEDSVDDLCKNIIGWELKRRSIEAECEASKPKRTYLDGFIKWIRKKVIIWHQSKRE